MVLIILQLFSCNSLYTCGFSSSDSKPYTISGPLLRDSTYKSIRITPVFNTLSLASKYIDTFKYDIVNGALTWYANTISIKRLKKPLSFSKLSGKQCGNFNITSDSVGTKYPDTDILVIINLIDANNGTSAQSYLCAREEGTFMPLIAMINYLISDFNEHPYEFLFSTMVHQLSHVLVFNEDYFDKFQKPDGSLYTYDQVVQSYPERDTTVFKLQTPNVLQKAQELFDCPTMTGVELEPSSKSHWEKRLMNDEFMVIDSEIHDIVYSSITLALFEDSGWYQVDYSYASLPQWGVKQGCLFTSQKCVINQVATNQLFNTDRNNKQCDYKRLNKGITNIKKYSEDIQAAFQYFSDPKEGGDPYADYCPFALPSAKGNCRGLGAGSTEIIGKYGENVGENGRCVEGNFTLSGDTFWHASCHQVTCYDSWVDIKIGDTTASCPFSGGFVGVSGYKGFVDCYYSNRLCLQKPCPNACSGQGLCSQGTCRCDDGTIGGDCRKYSTSPEDSTAISHLPHLSLSFLTTLCLQVL